MDTSGSFIDYNIFGDNQLSGFIPSQIGNLGYLNSFRLNGNQLTGEIPESICELIIDFSSYDFNISNNNFCPSYPDCIEDYVGYQDISDCVVEGCTDETACNYNLNASIDDGSCEYPEDFGWCDCDGNIYDECGICNGEEECFVYERELNQGSNLISFWVLPEDKSIGNVLSNVGYCISGVIGEGVAASNLGSCEDGGCTWVGSLNEIEYTSGYWVIADYDCSLEFEGYMAENLVFELLMILYLVMNKKWL